MSASSRRVMTEREATAFAEGLSPAPDGSPALSAAVRTGAVRPAAGGLYLDRTCDPPADDPEAAAAIRPGAIVSLLSVLGDDGILNNYPREVWSVFPQDPQATPRKHVPAPAGYGRDHRFLPIPADVLDAPERRDAFGDGKRYPRATPEAALAHWLYLSSDPRVDASDRLSEPPVHDVDVSLLDESRLLRVADAMGLGATCREWLSRVDRDDEEKVAPGLGF